MTPLLAMHPTFQLCDPAASVAFCTPTPRDVWVGNTPAHWPFNGSCLLPQNAQHHAPGDVVVESHAKEAQNSYDHQRHAYDNQHHKGALGEHCKEESRAK